MTDRERYLQSLLFGKPDRIPFQPGGPRESTLKHWHATGLPEGVDWQRHTWEQIGIEPPSTGGSGVFLHHQMIPQFEEKVIEEKQDSLIVQDWKGNICEISRRYDVSYLRSARDFVTRKWIKCPVESWEDWEQMRTRYDASDPSRAPANLNELAEQLARRDHVVGVSVHGPFWQLREWLGFEALCTKFLDDPALIREMIAFWTDYMLALFDRLLPYVTLDYVVLAEDMAYKQKSMISPAMAREFLAPCYAAWVDAIRSSGCPIVDVDCDGCVAELIPVWIDAGVNVTSPMEVAAGNDINAFKAQFGTRIGFRGGIDKRAIAKGGQAIKQEMKRVEPAVRSGGYIPGCDHGVPSDVAWPQWLDYCDLLARMTGWK